MHENPQSLHTSIHQNSVLIIIHFYASIGQEMEMERFGAFGAHSHRKNNQSTLIN